MAAKVAAPHPVGIDANLEEREVIKQVEQEEMAEKVEKNKSLIAKRNNSPKPLAPSKGAIRTAAGFMQVHQDRVDREDGVQEKKTKKRNLSQRRAHRSQNWWKVQKANVISWRNQFFLIIPYVI